MAVEARKCESISTLTNLLGTYLEFGTSSSFKVIVILPQAKVSPRCSSESSALSRILPTGVANSQTLYYKYREVDVFLPQTKV